MLDPKRLAQLGAAVERQHNGDLALPRDIHGERIRQHMFNVFDQTQFGAIAVRTAPHFNPSNLCLCVEMHVLYSHTCMRHRERSRYTF